MAKLIKYCNGEKWTLEVPNNDIAKIFPNGNTVEVMRYSTTKNVICDQIEFKQN